MRLQVEFQFYSSLKSRFVRSIISSRDQETEQGRQRSIRVEHHVVLRAELGLGQPLQDVFELGYTLLHEIPSSVQINRLPIDHRNNLPLCTTSQRKPANAPLKIFRLNPRRQKNMFWLTPCQSTRQGLPSHSIHNEIDGATSNAQQPMTLLNLRDNREGRDEWRNLTRNFRIQAVAGRGREAPMIADWELKK